MRRRDVGVRQRIDPRWVIGAGVVAVLVVVVVVGRLLIGSQDGEKASYTPVSDERLFSDIRDLEGVTSVQVSYDDQADPAAYTGTVTVAQGRRLCPVLDRVFAILRQGHEGAAIDVTVAKETRAGRPQRTLTMQQVDKAVAADPTRRYGAQPGTGEPLDDRLCSDVG